MTTTESLKTKMYNGEMFDSEGEVMFAIWLNELRKAKIVDVWYKCKTPFILTEGLKINYETITKLKTKTKIVQRSKTLLRPSEYTPDFKVVFVDEYNDLLSYLDELNFNPNGLFYTNETYPFAYFEVKPDWDQNNMERLFVNNQKFVWNNLRIFVNLIEPIELFKRTFIPIALLEEFKYKTNKTGKWSKGDWKVKFKPKTLEEFLTQNK